MLIRQALIYKCHPQTLLLQYMKLNIFKISFLSLLVVLSCVEPIEFSIERGKNDSLVIDGRIVEFLNGDNNYAEVNIQRVFNFESSSRSTISAKKVVISNGIQSLELQQLGLGSYGKEFDESIFSLAEDLSFTLYVETLDGREYKSKDVKKPPLAIPEKLYSEIVSTEFIDSTGLTFLQDQVIISIDSPVKEFPNNGLLWEFQHTFQVSTTQPRKCYVTEDIIRDRIVFLDTKELRIDRLDDFTLFRTPISKKFREGLYFRVRQFSIDQEVTTNLRNITSLITRSATLFNDPLNKLTSNISNVDDPEEDVYGFFYATQAYDIRIKMDSVRTYCNRAAPQGTDREADCVLHFATLRPEPGSDLLCCDCRKEPGSSTIKPDWWK